MFVLHPATITTRTTYVGVSDLARETGLSQGYVSKLLAWGWRVDDIRARAEWAEAKRERRAEREGFEKAR
jgi:hypothetical protein